MKTKKLQIASDINGRIMAMGTLLIERDADEVPPSGCSLLPKENERIDLVELSPELAKLSVRELYQRGRIEYPAGKLKIDEAEERQGEGCQQ